MFQGGFSRECQVGLCGVLPGVWDRPGRGLSAALHTRATVWLCSDSRSKLCLSHWGLSALLPCAAQAQQPARTVASVRNCPARYVGQPLLCPLFEVALVFMKLK